MAVTTSTVHGDGSRVTAASGGAAGARPAPAATHEGISGLGQGTAPVPLSVLDLATVGAGHTASDALRTSVELARRTEARGYHRYWV
ncbi:hypothetical protein ACWD6I_30070, partial [Streptomyces sp. NPDC002454]